jgi:DNA replicative helicase MCM subunit Mcm2 (Cdc46/Mcm family)
VTSPATDVVPSPKTFAGIPIAPVRDTKANINVLIYGKPGVGKTFLAATADHVPAMRPVLYLNIEGGDMTLRHAAPEIRKIPEEGSLSWSQLQAVYDQLAKQCYNGVTPGEYAPRTVILDTLTECQKMNMSQIMAELLTAEPDKGWDPDIPDVRRWGKNIEQIRKWVRKFRDLPLNTIMTCHEMEDKDNMTGLVSHKPQLSGKLSNEVAGFFDVVVYLYVKQEDREGKKVTVRKLLTGALEGYVAKDRSGNLPPVLENPTMAEVYSYITTGITKKAS